MLNIKVTRSLILVILISHLNDETNDMAFVQFIFFARDNFLLMKRGRLLRLNPNKF